MQNDLTIINFDEIPMPYKSTLALYLIGQKPKEILAHNTYYKHKRELLARGFDISKPMKQPLRVQPHWTVLGAA